MKTVREIWRDEPEGEEADGDRAVDRPAPQRDLNAFLDGELPVAAHRALELRLATDPALRARVTELNQIRTLVLRAYGAMRHR